MVSAIEYFGTTPQIGSEDVFYYYEGNPPDWLTRRIDDLPRYRDNLDGYVVPTDYPNKSKHERGKELAFIVENLHGLWTYKFQKDQMYVVFEKEEDSGIFLMLS